MRKRLLRAGAYFAFFILAFLFSFYLTFDPTHIIGPRLKSAMASKGLEIDFAQLDNYRLSGFSAQDVTITPIKLKTAIKIDELRARIAILPLIWGRTSYSFSARLYEGEISGKIVESKKGLAAKLEAKKVDLSRLEVSKPDALWVMGTLNGNADLNLTPSDDPKKWRGQIQGGFGKGKLTSFTFQGFHLPEIQMDGLSLDLSLNSGRAEIKSLELKSPDLPLSGKGQIELRDPFLNSLIQLEAKINPSNAYLEQAPLLQAVLPPDKTIRYNATFSALVGAGL